METEYYIDPINGSQDNDGLSPSAAFKEFKEGLGSSGDICIFFLRRGTTLVVTESKKVQWFKVKRWPILADDNYATRPQAGIDAGWDSDVEDRPLIQIGAGMHFIWESANAFTGVANMYEVDLEFLSSSESILFYCYAISSLLKNVDIRGDQSMLRLYKVFGASPTNDEEANIEFNNVNIDNKSYVSREEGSEHSIVLWLANSSHIYYNINLIANNFNMRGVQNFAHLQQSHVQTREIYISMADSDVEVGSFGFTYSGPYGASANSTHVYVDFLRTRLYSYSGTPLFEVSRATNYFHMLHFNARDSLFLTTSKLVSAYNAWNSWDSRDSILDFTAKGCTFDVSHLIYYSSYNKYVTLNRIHVEDCTIKNAAMVFELSMQNVRGSGGLVFINNILDEVGSLINSPTATYPIETIVLKGQTLTGNLMTGYLHGGSVYLEDCNIAKPLTDNRASSVSFEIISSSVDALVGKGVTAKIEGSRVQASGNVFDDGASATALGCHIISDGMSIVGDSSVATIANSNLVAPQEAIGLISLSNSAYNGDIFETFNQNKSYTVKNIIGARDGATKAFRLEMRDGEFTVAGRCSNVSKTYNAADATVSAHMIFSDLDTRDSSRITLQFVDNGELKTISPQSVSDDDGAWGGYASSVEKVKAVFDMSIFNNIPAGSSLKLIVSANGAPAGGQYVVIDNILLGA